MPDSEVTQVLDSCTLSATNSTKTKQVRARRSSELKQAKMNNYLEQESKLFQYICSMALHVSHQPFVTSFSTSLNPAGNNPCWVQRWENHDWFRKNCFLSLVFFPFRSRSIQNMWPNAVHKCSEIQKIQMVPWLCRASISLNYWLLVGSSVVEWQCWNYPAQRHITCSFGGHNPQTNTSICQQKKKKKLDLNPAALMTSSPLVQQRKFNSTLEVGRSFSHVHWCFVVYLSRQKPNWWEELGSVCLHQISPPSVTGRLRCHAVMPRCHLPFISNESSEIGLSPLLILLLKSLPLLFQLCLGELLLSSSALSYPRCCNLYFISDAVTMALTLDPALMIGN